MKIEEQGKIEYEISLIMTGKIPETIEYSKDHWMKRLRHNLPEKRIVYFNGTYSRTEEITIEYGFKSKTITIRKVNSRTYTYCKIFPEIKFCLDIEQEVGTQEYFPPQVKLLDEYKDIGGYLCRKATVEKMAGIYEIYFTPDFFVNDPTQAVIQEEGVQGFIIQQDEIPGASNIYYYRRYAVNHAEFSPLPTDLFTTPSGYVSFPSIDAARKENRRLMNERAEKELQANPLTEKEKKLFAGYWFMKSGEDLFALHIQYNGSQTKWENKYVFRSINTTAGKKSAREWVTEEASLLGRELLVEDPPNFRIYSYNYSTNNVELSGSDLFRFKKSDEKEINALFNN